MPLLSFFTGVSNVRALSVFLKLSLLATGCAGIVAEFVLSTLATYLLGNAVFQWTIVMSLMLFAMGIGSRVSKHFRHHLLDTFIVVEFVLSVVCASSTTIAYGLAGYTTQLNLVIYATAFAVGLLIGLELPLVTRMNEAYEDLRLNISSVMERDYYGALIGGFFFAFFALPHLGLTYTPIVLGGINFLVASLLLWRFLSAVKRKRLLACAFTLSCAFLLVLTVSAKPVIRYGEQSRYRDKVIYAQQTPYQKIVMTRWKSHYWLYLNGQEQFSTYDEERYHEPLVHPALEVASDKSRVLVLGGGDGLAVRELLKHPEVRTVTLVDMDPDMTRLAVEHPVLVEINQGSMTDGRVRIVNDDAASFLKHDDALYNVILVDMPDPDTTDLMHVYSVEFYRMARDHLARGGVLATQATSPFFSNDAFLCILKTVRSAGFTVLAYHNHIPTMGEWGWVMGVRSEEMTAEALRRRVLSADFSGIETRFLNQEAMVSMVHFGKGAIDRKRLEGIQPNTETSPQLYRYYMAGNWGAY